MVNELFSIRRDDEEMKVSVRELHRALEIKERFSAWFKRIEKYFGNDEFTSVGKPTAVNNGAELMLDDYETSVENAKHICLMCRTDKGKQCRQYLIDLEKAWNTPEQVMARALKMADKTIAKLKGDNQKLIEEVNVKNQVIGELKPKADYTDKILNWIECRFGITNLDIKFTDTREAFVTDMNGDTMTLRYDSDAREVYAL